MKTEEATGGGPMSSSPDAASREPNTSGNRAKKRLLLPRNRLEHSGSLEPPNLKKNNSGSGERPQAHESHPFKPNTENQRKWCERILTTKVKSILREFESIRDDTADNAEKDGGAERLQEAKNRYPNIPLAEKSRVVLRHVEHGYIHASWVRVPSHGSAYICAQGPLDSTVDDFWSMMLQEKVRIILQLCDYVEGEKEKCARYLPEKPADQMQCGEVTVRNDGEGSTIGLPLSARVTKLHVSSKTLGLKSVTLEHVLLPDWPDQSAPANADDIVKLYGWMKDRQQGKRPVVVHCSAGIGRSVTFVAIDYASVCISNDPNRPMADVVQEIRRQRIKGIQSAYQYLFLHVCMLDNFARENVIQLDDRLRIFKDEYARIVERKNQKQKAAASAATAT
ncbi:unnamed protein product, partial [Mesorhabditis spiculigera]